MSKKKYTNWFPHDANPLNDRNLKTMFSRYKAAGYGIWWRLQEILCNQPGYKLDITDEYAYQELADDVRCDAETIIQFVNDCIDKFHLLAKDNNYLWCPALLDAMKPLEEKRAFLSECGKRGAEKKKEKKPKATENAREAKGGLINLERVAEAGVPISEAEKRTVQNSREENSTTENSIITHTDIDDVVVVDNPETKTIHTPNATVLPMYPFADMHAMKQRAVADKEFTYITMQSYSISEAQLQQWLDAFNRKLAFEGDTIKNDKEYRRHFTNWLKYRDVKTEDPATYTPITTTLPPGKGNKSNAPSGPPGMSAQEALARHRASRALMLQKLKAG